MATKTKTKTCSQCKTEKPISKFGQNLSLADGLSAYCKHCLRTKLVERPGGHVKNETAKDALGYVTTPNGIKLAIVRIYPDRVKCRSEFGNQVDIPRAKVEQ